ncbi:hypothetical protein [Azospirillum sp. B506]|uniref:hypothetical protein n=1 Tax=Azospirillum sp. B506 TaxID=137721 RepID=UPI0005B2BF68|nr:hypothetical protein [Azospirillum sp. B506]
MARPTLNGGFCARAAPLRTEWFTGSETSTLPGVERRSANDDTTSRTMDPQKGATAARTVAAPSPASSVPEAAQQPASGQGAAPAVGSAIYDRSGQGYPVIYRGG